MQRRIPSCTECLNSRIGNVARDGQFCRRCHDWSLPTHPLSFSNLTSRCLEIMENMEDSAESRKHAMEQLQSIGLSKRRSSSIVSSPYSSGSHDVLELPPLWKLSGLDLGDFVETFNHLLFLGLVKSTARDILFDWLKKKRQWRSFLETFSGSVWDHLVHLRLSWLKAERISPTGLFGGFVSES